MASAPQLLIDIGQNSVKALLVSGGKKSVTVRKAVSLPLELAGGSAVDEPAGASQGSDESATSTRAQDLKIKTAHVLKSVVAQVGGKGKRAMVALPGRQAFSRPVTVPLIRGRQLERIVRYEARQQIPFPIDQVNLDYHIHPGDSDQQNLDVTILAVRKEVAAEAVKAVRSAGAKADILDVGPVALFNAYLGTVKADPDEVTAVVNIGASGTDIVIEQNGELRFMRSAPLGGDTLTGLLAKQFKLDWGYAESLKSKPADAYGSQEEEHDIAPEDVAAVLEKGFELIVTEIRRSLDFYVSQSDASSVTRVLLAGGTCRMEGVVEFLEERLGVQVLQPDFTEMEGLNWQAQNREDFKPEAILMGLVARQMLDTPAFNVAPSSTKQRLDFERRLPLLSIAAVLLVAILGGGFTIVQQAMEHERQALDRLRTIVEPGGGSEMKEDVKYLQTLTQEIKDFNSRYEKLDTVLAKRGQRTGYYLQLAEVVPEDVWLSKVAVSSDLTVGEQMTIEGKTVSTGHLLGLLDAIRLSPYFQDDAVMLTAEGAEEGSLTFTIEINGFRDPSPEELKFVALMRAVKDSDLQLVKAMIEL